MISVWHLIFFMDYRVEFYDFHDFHNYDVELNDFYDFRNSRKGIS